MSEAKSPLKIDALKARFSQLLTEAGTSMEQPSPAEAWRAFSALVREPVECDDERLFFEADISSTDPDSFYLHFARTCYGREPKGHVWSFDVICDFLFPLDEDLENFSITIEAEDVDSGSPERNEFLVEVDGQGELWAELANREPVKASVYVGES
jgi:hypothetical protein